MKDDLVKPFVISQVAAEKSYTAYQKRLTDAEQAFNNSLKTTYENQTANTLSANFYLQPTELWQAWQDYVIDSAERTVLFWDTLRQRGDNYLELKEKGNPPVLHFNYEILLDARKFEKPVNYALARIIPPKGIKIDNNKRPYVIIDPRAGQVPGIGGFKDDSQVGVALKAGHPVYFVLFFPTPETNQTILDVTDVENIFLKKVCERHPDSPKPIVIGNCQGGWAVMMLAAANPKDVGVLLLNGSPLSYWGGAWISGKGNNPMRYAGGLMGGSWTTSLASDIGNGHFDGAYLVRNFENLNPANTLWTKYRTVYSKIDTEPPRFLDFEKWWGSLSLMNGKEMEWIVQNLFIGNDLWTGKIRANDGQPLDIRNIHCPIVIFASLGDNITPPQQAFNWLADIYSSTDEIKAKGQVIVGLLHESIGHLGVFVSGQVARKEYTELVPVIDNIEALNPGLYAMKITAKQTKEGEEPSYTVSFREYQLEDIIRHLNKYKRIDEQPFKAVEVISEFNQKAYELFTQPAIRSMANEPMAELIREVHPSRVEKWAVSSSYNPFMNHLKPIAEKVKENRHTIDRSSNPFAVLEETFSNTIEASLDLYRDVRDAMTEALFYSIYTSPFGIYLIQKDTINIDPKEPEKVKDPTKLPAVQHALYGIDQDGLFSAIIRTILLLEKTGEHITLDFLEAKKESIQKYLHLLPKFDLNDIRKIRGKEEIICHYYPHKALKSLPNLLVKPEDKETYVKFFTMLYEDAKATCKGCLSPQQKRLAKRIHNILNR